MWLLWTFNNFFCDVRSCDALRILALYPSFMEKSSPTQRGKRWSGHAGILSYIEECPIGLYRSFKRYSPLGLKCAYHKNYECSVVILQNSIHMHMAIYTTRVTFIWCSISVLEQFIMQTMVDCETFKWNMVDSSGS